MRSHPAGAGRKKSDRYPESFGPQEIPTDHSSEPLGGIPNLVQVVAAAMPGDPIKVDSHSTAYTADRQRAMPTRCFSC